MARSARLESPTGYYHVMIRGNNRETIFKKAVEKRYFIELLQHTIEENKIAIVAYCLMDNHIHLLLHSELQTMSKALKWINIKFAGRYNHKYERIGHVFQDRFKSEIIDTEGYLIRALRYIHNNPVKAKMVSDVSAYKWSSYNSYTGRGNVLVDAAEKQIILGLFQGSIERFKIFHLKEDDHEFLETEEDLERDRLEKAQNIINKYRQRNQDRNGGIDGLNLGKETLEEVILELIKRSHLSHRKIAELVGVNRGVVHRIAKKA